ncbi:MAG: hypothetical protein RLZZ127_374 [Planctomycetota bacterium]|jgi:flavin reductase (DIM6/NTAB) family NADH-FMN oxidoreductase RutF
MHRLAGDDLDPRGWSDLLTTVLVPRPIAWITTRSEDGIVNLAPFSFVTVAAASPPTLVVSIAPRQPEKDTLRHLRDTGEAVVHLVPPDLAIAANASSAPFPPTVSEPAVLGLATAAMPPVAVPRLVSADVALACRLDRLVPVGDPPAHLALLRVVAVEVADAVATADGRPDPGRLRAWARLGGDGWLDPAGWAVRRMPRPLLSSHLSSHLKQS